MIRPGASRDQGWQLSQKGRSEAMNYWQKSPMMQGGRECA
jgi:hypothetical protein